MTGIRYTANAVEDIREASAWVRRHHLRGFPYQLLYTEDPAGSVVIACFHVRRDPKRPTLRHLPRD